MKAVIIGAGRMGRRHISVLRQLRFELVGLVDCSRLSLQLCQKEHQLTDCILFANPAPMYAQMIPECLIIATTADSHCKLVCEAAERGVKYILVEKPLATSLDECDQMILVCEKYGVRLAVNHQMRFLEQYTRPKTLLYSPEYGGFKSMTVVAGNFGLSMNGTHFIEAFRFMANEEPVAVNAWFSDELIPNPRGTQFQDRAGSIRVVTSSGKRLYMEISADQGHGIVVTYAGRNGLITVNELAGELNSTLREEQYRDLSTTRYGMPAVNQREIITPAEIIDSTAAVLNALITCENSVTAEQGKLSIKVLVAAYESAESGGATVKLDLISHPHRTFPWA